MLAERHGRPTWKPPAPYGYPETVQAAGMIVAPLLAGFTITLIGLLLSSSQPVVGHPSAALALLVTGAVMLVAAVQCAYAARQYVVTPAELQAWWPGIEDPADEGEIDQWWELRAEQLAHRELHDRWAVRFRWLYHAGILFVLLGLTAVLIPGGFPGHVSATRWVAIGMAAVATLAEAAWILATELAGSQALSGKPCVSAALAWFSPSYEDAVGAARTQLESKRTAAL